MPLLTIPVGCTIRDSDVRLPPLGVGANISSSMLPRLSNGNVERTEKRQINAPEWSFTNTIGVSSYFRKHNNFKDQELHNRITRGMSVRHGTSVKYYTTSYDPSKDPLYREDNNRTLERVFDLPIILSFQPQNELYSRFGIQHLDEMETHIHMSLFLELNYASLRKHAIQPACDPNEHNPIWSQRGYEAFRFHGYSFEQIGPKQGDMVKIEAFDSLYTVESVKKAAPEYQHRWRQYWWKVFLKDAYDVGNSISPEIGLTDAQQSKFLNNILGIQSENKVDDLGNPIKYQFDVSCATDVLKRDILFRPPEVAPDVTDISKDPNFYPCNDKLFGTW